MSQASALERLLRRDRAIIAVGLIVLCALAWLYLLIGAGFGHDARDMAMVSLFPHKTDTAATAMESMPGMAGMEMNAAPWGWRLSILTVAMWWVMMVAMMTPSAAPTVLLYARVHRHARAEGKAVDLAPAFAFVAGYVLVWLGFSLAATGLQWGLERSEVVSGMMIGSQSQWLSAGILCAAGVYQLSPLQAVCLNHCRSPAAFLSRHWRPGSVGAVRLGAFHGAYCVGCCWLLMALLFVGGVMNLVWIAALTLVVAAEKLLPGGRLVARLSGLILLVWAVATLLV